MQNNGIKTTTIKNYFTWQWPDLDELDSNVGEPVDPSTGHDDITGTVINLHTAWNKIGSQQEDKT